MLPELVRSWYLRKQLQAYVVFITALVTANSFFKRVRMSHENGITLRGTLRIVADPTFPEHQFFGPGLTFDCRVRHGAASWIDDAKLVVRSASVKFGGDRIESELDIMMNSGAVPLFWNARTFLEFMFGTMGGRGKAWVPYLRSHPQALVGGADSVRRNPDTFARLVYNTQTCLGFVGVDGVYRYVRYRLIPHPWDGTETGLPDAEDRAHPWLQNPYLDEGRTRNYLKDEIRHRLEVDHEAVHYMLQIQLREKPPGPDPEWVTSEYPWDESPHPWHDLADVVLDKALDYREAMLTWFDMANHPDSLPVPRGRSIDDPHSLNDLRLASIAARKARVLSYRIRGMPKQFPDSRKASDWVGAPPMPDPP